MGVRENLDLDAVDPRYLLDVDRVVTEQLNASDFAAAKADNVFDTVDLSCPFRHRLRSLQHDGEAEFDRTGLGLCGILELTIPEHHGFRRTCGHDFLGLQYIASMASG